MDHLAIVQHLFGRLMHLPWHLAIGVEVGGPGMMASRNKTVVITHNHFFFLNRCQKFKLQRHT